MFNTPGSRAQRKRVTPATGGAMTRLAQIVTKGSQAVVDFTNIPSGYSHLRMVLAAQDTGSGNTYALTYLQFNGDNNISNYTSTGRVYEVGNAGDTSGVNAQAIGGFLSVLNSTTNYPGICEVTIPAYTSSVFYKGAFINWMNLTTLSGMFHGDSAFYWKSTAAVNRLTITPPNAFVDGSMFTLYGMS